MEYLFLLIPAGIFVLAYFLRGDRSFQRPEVSAMPEGQLHMFEAAPSLFVNAAEAALFQCLRKSLSSHFHIHSKVRLEDIIRVKRGVNEKLRWAARGRVKSRHVDYLITTAGGFRAARMPLRRIRTGEDFVQISTQIAADLSVKTNQD